MSYIVNKYVRQFSGVAYDVFGLTRDDLYQNVRIAFWRGLATFDPSRNCKVTTYLSVILFHYFMSFSKKCKSSKNCKAKLYPVEELFEKYDESKQPPSAQDQVHWDESVSYLLEKLSDKEKSILKYYANEESGISQISSETGIPKAQVAKTIKNIRIKVISHYRELQDEEDYIHYEDIGDSTDDDLDESTKRVLATKR